MTKNIIRAIAVVLTLLLALSGCSMIVIDQEMDDAEAVAIVNGEVITKVEARNLFYANVNFYSQLYQMYGLSFTEDMIPDIAKMTIDQMISDRLVQQKAVEMGLVEFTDEELEALKADANEQFETYVDQYQPELTTEEMTEEEARQATVTYLNDNGVTLDNLLEDVRREAIRERVNQAVIADVVVTDEEIQAAYEEALQNDESSYANNRYSFETAMQRENSVTWMPEGYRRVKHILFAFSDEQQAELDRLSADITSFENQIAALEEGAPLEDEDQAEDDIGPADPNAEPEDHTEAIADLTAQIVAAEQEINAIKARHLSDITTNKLPEITAKLEEGASFDELIAEYGEDPLMKTEPAQTVGVFVSAASAAYDEEYIRAAMALQAIGDISDPVVTVSGVFIIRYEADVTPGPVDIALVRDALAETLLTEKQTQTFNDAVAAWEEAAKIQRFPERLT